jgi:transposase InsO family protein
VTTDSRHAHPIAPNLLDRQFDVDQVAAANRVWVGDITCLPTREGWLYLAVVLDLGSRRVIGWAMRYTLDGALARDALTMALRSRHPGHGVLHHTDRGSQYAVRGRPVLSSACATFPGGSAIALVGISGAGKSSILKLICGFHGPDCGRIEIGGISVKDVPISWLRSQ